MREDLGCALENLKQDIIRKSGKSAQENAENPSKELVDLFMISCILNDICEYVNTVIEFDD